MEPHSPPMEEDRKNRLASPIALKHELPSSGKGDTASSLFPTAGCRPILPPTPSPESHSYRRPQMGVCGKREMGVRGGGGGVKEEEVTSANPTLPHTPPRASRKRRRSLTPSSSTLPILPNPFLTPTSKPLPPPRHPASPSSPSSDNNATPGPSTPSQKPRVAAKTPATPPTTPSRAQLAEWKKDWLGWCARNRWVGVRGFAHDPTAETINKTPAKWYFLEKDELLPLPFTRFSFTLPATGRLVSGQTYAHEDVRRLAWRKQAMLKGICGEDGGEERMLEEGERLFWLKHNIMREKKDSKRPPHPEVHRARPRLPSNDYRRSDPLGSWRSPVYENGVCIGTWLNFQFDPESPNPHYEGNRFEPNENYRGDRGGEGAGRQQGAKRRRELTP